MSAIEPGRPAALALDAQDPNVVALTMRTPKRGFNRMVVAITVCAPGTQRCATIDDVMVDTGATGLRLEAEAVPDWLRLPAQVDAEGRPRAQCVQFVQDDAWGPLHRADLTLGGMVARDLVVQILDDHDPRRPPSCRGPAGLPTSNGTLGLGPFRVDCPGACEQSEERPRSFACEAAACRPVPGPVAWSDRLPNPVSLFGDHDNGIVIDLPPAAVGGSVAVTGTLTFGVGTAANNRLGAAALVTLDAGGRFTTLYEGRAYPDSYIDSGTGTYIVPGGGPPDGPARCAERPWALCVAPERQLGAVMVGRDGARVATAFRVGSYEAVLAGGFGASDSIATAGGAASRAFVWGAPFFLGKRVAVLMERRGVPGRPDVTGPLYAIEDLRPR